MSTPATSRPRHLLGADLSRLVAAIGRILAAEPIARTVGLGVRGDPRLVAATGRLASRHG